MLKKKEVSMKSGPAAASSLAVWIPIRLHVRNDLHLARKAWHMFMGLFMVAMYLTVLSRSASVLILGFFLGLNLLVESLRLKIPALNERILRLWGPLMRSCEVKRMSGTPYYLSSAILAVGIFPEPIAALSILFLAVGDPLASLAGIMYGDRSIRFSNGKSLIGSLAGTTACFVVGFLFLAMLGLPLHQVLVLSFVGAVAGGGAELLPLEVDDNFSIPIVSGFALWLACIIFGIAF